MPLNSPFILVFICAEKEGFQRKIQSSEPTN